MSELQQINPMDVSLPDAAQVSEYLNGIVGTAQSALADAYAQARRGQPVGGALMIIDQQLNALREFGEQAIPIIAGLQEMVLTITEQRDELVREVTDARDELVDLEENYNKLEAEVEEIDPEEIAADVEFKRETDLEWLTGELRDHGMEAEAATLEEMRGATAQARESLEDQADKYRQTLNELFWQERGRIATMIHPGAIMDEDDEAIEDAELIDDEDYDDDPDDETLDIDEVDAELIDDEDVPL